MKGRVVLVDLENFETPSVVRAPVLMPRKPEDEVNTGSTAKSISSGGFAPVTTAKSDTTDNKLGETKLAIPSVSLTTESTPAKKLTSSATDPGTPHEAKTQVTASVLIGPQPRPRFSLFYSRRQLDYTKIKPDADTKTPAKPFILGGNLSASPAPKYSGSRMEGVGPRQKIGKTGAKTYYVMNHLYTEYFWNEILQIIGFNTPKCRFVIAPKLIDRTYQTATKSIMGYVPIRVLRNPRELPSDSHWDKLRRSMQKYRLSIPNQTIEQNHEGRPPINYKITGYLFCMNIPALLTGNRDLQPKGENIGLKRHGNRWIAQLIDQDIDPDNLGKSPTELLAILQSTSAKNSELKTAGVHQDELFRTRENDQYLAVLYGLKTSFEKKADLCPMQQIFHNPRVEATFRLALQNHAKGGMESAIPPELFYNRFRTTALQFLDEAKLEEKDWEAFRLREAGRHLAAQQVMTELNLPDECYPTIMEDLRGPYYKHYFPRSSSSEYKMTTEGIAALKKDFANELFHDITGLEGIFEERIAHYYQHQAETGRKKAIDAIRSLFRELRTRPSDSAPLPSSEIAIMIGGLIHYRDTAQTEHASQWTRFLSSHPSTLATIIDQTLDEFCHMTPAEKTACLESYKTYEESMEATRELSRINNAYQELEKLGLS